MREIKGPELSSLTTIRLGGRAIACLIFEKDDDPQILQYRLKSLGGQPFCIGRGSNLLARDGELPLVLVRVNDSKISIVEETDGKVLVRAGAGCSLRALLRFCIENGLGGLEGLAGVPGSIGGAVAMNAGSFGNDVKSCLFDVNIMQGNEIMRLFSNQLQMSYRKTVFPGLASGTIILDATFALTRQVKNVIFTQTRLNFLKKKSRQPLDAKSAGCAFKNPSELSAGKLLELAGFRGKKLGGMAFSQKHANFLVNEENGSAAAALDLLQMARCVVKEKFGVDLETEIRIVPELR